MRIQVNLSEEMVEKLNDYSKKFGVTRSSLCAMWLGQCVAGLDTATRAVESMATIDLSKDVESGLGRVPQE